MNWDVIIIGSILATAFMTLFSYMVAWASGQPYKEPLLLTVLLNKFHVADRGSNRIIGWVLHYLIGVLFVLGFDLLVFLGWIEASWETILVYGIIIGFIGIFGWKILFALPNRKPQLYYPGYYTQLFIAHLVFAFTVLLCYRLF